MKHGVIFNLIVFIKLQEIRSSGRTPSNESWIQCDVSYVVSVCEPRDESIKSKTVTSMRTCTVLPLVSVPVVRSRVKFFSFVSVHQFLKVIHPHRSSDNLPHVRHQQIDSLANPFVIWILLHVKCFHVRRESTQKNRFANRVCHPPLRHLWNVFSELVEGSVFFLVTVILQPCNGILVVHSFEGSFRWFEVRVDFFK